MKRIASEEPSGLRPPIKILHSCFINSHGDSNTYHGNAYYGNMYYENAYYRNTHYGNVYNEIFTLEVSWPTRRNDITLENPHSY